MPTKLWSGMESAVKLPHSFYNREGVAGIARELIGKVLCTHIDGHTRKGIIIETEAYAGESDKASHAYGGRKTRRTHTLYGPPGRAYIYLCYGIHHLFNVVTHAEGIPHAVLIRGVEPFAGITQMKKARGNPPAKRPLSYGPGTLSQALGIKIKQDATPLTGPLIWLEDYPIEIAGGDIVAGPRIGVDYAGDDALLPYRFLIAPKDLRSKYLSELKENP